MIETQQKDLKQNANICEEVRLPACFAMVRKWDTLVGHLLVSYFIGKTCV